MDNFSGLRVSSRIPANDEEPRTETEAQGEREAGQLGSDARQVRLRGALPAHNL